MAAKEENSLETQLAKRGFESVSVARPMAAGEVKVEATKLHRLPTAGEEPVYAPIPVSLSVKLDKSGRIQSIEGDTPSDNAVKDAVHFLNGLRERGQVVDEASPPPQTKMAGHLRLAPLIRSCETNRADESSGAGAFQWCEAELIIRPVRAGLDEAARTVAGSRENHQLREMP